MEKPNLFKKCVWLVGGNHILLRWWSLNSNFHVKISVSLPAKTVEKLDKLTTYKGRSRSKYIANAITQRIEASTSALADRSNEELLQTIRSRLYLKSKLNFKERYLLANLDLFLDSDLKWIICRYSELSKINFFSLFSQNLTLIPQKNGVLHIFKTQLIERSPGKIFQIRNPVN